MMIKCIVNGRWQENCYLVSNNKSTVIIDPGGNVEQIYQYVNDHEYMVMAVINTHAHFDHIGAVADLIDKYQCPFYLHSKDLRLLRSANLYITLFAGEKSVRIPSVDYLLDEISYPITFADLSIDILFTPGHTEGSVCILIGNNLFTGDTLLRGNVGRVDLPGGNKEKLKKSLVKISNLPKEFIIYPGHGEPSSLAEEILSNDTYINLLK